MFAIVIKKKLRMKKIIGILTALIMCFTLSSCITTASAQNDDMYDDVDISVVVTYGTPYYNTEGLLLYYIYRDMFYYPYYYNNRYYLHRYSRPLPPPRARMYKPLPRDFYRHEPSRRYHVTPPNKSRQHIRPNTRSIQPIPNRNVRPMTPRSSTRAAVGSTNRGHFGGNRR